MENVFNPEHRKWISPLTPLNDSIQELKQLVRLQREALLVINPSEGAARFDFERQQQRGESSSSGAERGSQLLGTFIGGGDRLTDVPHEESIESESAILYEELNKFRRNKWSESDDACAAAVAFVGGPDFFDLKKDEEERKKKKKKKGGRGRRKSNNAPAPEEGDDDEAEAAAGDASAADVGTPSKNTENVDSDMYEKFNYGVHIKEEEAEDEAGEIPIDIDELKKISGFVPEAFIESDDDFFDYDEDEKNFVGAADRHELYLEKYRELLDSDDDDDTKELGYNSSDCDEQNDTANFNETTATVDANISFGIDDDEVPGTSKVANMLVKVEPTQQTTTRTDPCDSVPAGGAEGAVPAICSADQSDKHKAHVTDFQRFIDWVFQHSKKKDREYAALQRPGLMNAFNMTAEEVMDMQRVTSASLTTVKGEVFQDEAVMKSSSMPLLSPPIEQAARSTLQSLAVFITHGEDPSCFPWKSVNVQQQINDDFAHDEFVKRMEQQKADVMNPEMKHELVDKEDDFLIQLLIYQATDPDDVLPDEVKLRRRAEDEIESGCSHYWRRAPNRVTRGEDAMGNSVGGQNRYIEPKLAYELNLLGSQTVGDLVNAIHCENDYVYLEDVSHPDKYTEDPQHYAKQKFPSSMILIHDTIYSDSTPSQIDYADIINKWANCPPEKHVGPFKRGGLNTKLKDLSIRFGMPYVYVHLGGCEHVFVFTKARLLHLEDEHLLRNYPKIVGMTRFKNIYCRVDNEYLARWAVLGYKEFPENPMLLCTECVRMYCYDKKQQKRGDFKLYPFTQMANLI